MATAKGRRSANGNGGSSLDIGPEATGDSLQRVDVGNGDREKNEETDGAALRLIGGLAGVGRTSPPLRPLKIAGIDVVMD